METIIENIKSFMKNSSVLTKIAIGLVPILILVAIIAVIVFARTPVVDNNVKVSDFDAIVDAPQNYKDEVESKIWNFIKANDYFDDASNFEATIREGTYKRSESNNKVQESFIVDIDELHYSFDVNIVWVKNKNITEDLSISITCPHYLDVKYTDTKCIVDSPIQQVKRYLPHYDNVDGVKYAVIYKQYMGEEYLLIEVPACGSEAIVKNALDSTKQWLKKIYLDPNDYIIKETDICNS